MKAFSVLVAAATVCAAFATSAAAKPGPYLLPTRVEALFQEHGLAFHGKQFKVLDIGCVGAGLPGPKQPDEVGIRFPTYHIFQCYIDVQKIPAIDRIRVETRRGGKLSWQMY